MSEIVRNLLKDVSLPRFVRVRQEFSKEKIEDVPAAVFAALPRLARRLSACAGDADRTA